MYRAICILEKILDLIERSLVRVFMIPNEQNQPVIMQASVCTGCEKSSWTKTKSEFTRSLDAYS